MKTAINLAIASLLFTSAAVNFAFGPLVGGAAAQTSECSGVPPYPDCVCCTQCGCWMCPESDD